MKCWDFMISFVLLLFCFCMFVISTHSYHSPPLPLLNQCFFSPTVCCCAFCFHYFFLLFFLSSSFFLQYFKILPSWFLGISCCCFCGRFLVSQQSPIAVISDSHSAFGIFLNIFLVLVLMLDMIGAHAHEKFYSIIFVIVIVAWLVHATTFSDFKEWQQYTHTQSENVGKKERKRNM